MKIKFTPDMWQQILGFRVIDPDGWDRQGDFMASWNEPLTFNEFMNKADESTCSRYPSDRGALREIALNRILPNIPNAKNEVNKLL